MLNSKIDLITDDHLVKNLIERFIWPCYQVKKDDKNNLIDLRRALSTYVKIRLHTDYALIRHGF